jgi:hypothetical protein
MSLSFMVYLVMVLFWGSVLLEWTIESLESSKPQSNEVLSIPFTWTPKFETGGHQEVAEHFLWDDVSFFCLLYQNWTRSRPSGQSQPHLYFIYLFSSGNLYLNSKWALCESAFYNGLHSAESARISMERESGTQEFLCMLVFIPFINSWCKMASLMAKPLQCWSSSLHENSLPVWSYSEFESAKTLIWTDTGWWFQNKL